MLFPQARPNAAHWKLAELEAAGKLTAVVTQNIDGLHQAAGSKTVYELHGSVHRNHCMKCRRFYGLDFLLETGGVPCCPACGGVVKPDVVLYEECLDETTMEGAVEAIAGADMLIIGGTNKSATPTYTERPAWSSMPLSAKYWEPSGYNRRASAWTPLILLKVDKIRGILS